MNEDDLQLLLQYTSHCGRLSSDWSHSVLDSISPSVIIYFEFPLPGERSIDSKYTIAPHIRLH